MATNFKIIDAVKAAFRENPRTREHYTNLANAWAAIRFSAVERVVGRYNTASRFDRLYRDTPDPWGYEGCSIATVRRANMLEILPRPRYATMLEIGCSEGWMTPSLAARTDALLATDFSPVALERAKKACHDIANVKFERCDVLKDPIVGSFDVVVCAGVLVFLPMTEQTQIRDRIVAAVAPGGDLLLEHTRRAFPGAVAGTPIHTLYRNHPQLELVVHREIEDYEILLFRKAGA